MSCLPKNLTGALIPSQDVLEGFIRAEYETTHPDNTFDDFKRRSTFERYDKGLMKDWLVLAAERHANKLQLERQTDRPPSDAFTAILDNLSSL